MKALVYTQPHRLELQDLPLPQRRSGEVLVGIRAVGVCGSDLDGFLGRSKKRIPPLVLGHEFCGEIVEVGAEISDFKMGERVAVYPLLPCGECRYCRAERENICPKRKLYGLDFHGGLAEYVSAPRACLFRLPPEMPVWQGALVEPLANAVHVLSKYPTIEGATGLIYGAGPIGALIFGVAKYLGAARLAVVDTNPRRLDPIKQLGADRVISALEQDPVPAILDWAGEDGVDFAVDAVGHSVCRRNVVACTAPGGTCIWIGLAEDPGNVDARAIVTREIQIQGCYAYTRHDFSRALTLIQQRFFPLERLVSMASLEEGQQVFEDLATGKSSMTKVIFTI